VPFTAERIDDARSAGRTADTGTAAREVGSLIQTFTSLKSPRRGSADASNPVITIAASFAMGTIGSLVLTIIPAALADYHKFRLYAFVPQPPEGVEDHTMALPGLDAGGGEFWRRVVLLPGAERRTPPPNVPARA
jgi:hypothetical protein